MTRFTQCSDGGKVEGENEKDTLFKCIDSFPNSPRGSKSDRSEEKKIGNGRNLMKMKLPWGL